MRCPEFYTRRSGLYPMTNSSPSFATLPSPELHSSLLLWLRRCKCRMAGILAYFCATTLHIRCRSDNRNPTIAIETREFREDWRKGNIWCLTASTGHFCGMWPLSRIIGMIEDIIRVVTLPSRNWQKSSVRSSNFFGTPALVSQNTLTFIWKRTKWSDLIRILPYSESTYSYFEFLH